MEDIEALCQKIKVNLNEKQKILIKSKKIGNRYVIKVLILVI